MKKYQKNSLISIVALSTIVLVACGTSKKSEDSSGVTTLHMYQIGDKPKDNDILMSKANKILEKKAKVKLNISYIGWGDYAKKMNIIVSSGEPYDIAFAQEYGANAAKGAYADITKLFPKYANKTYKALNPAYIEGNKINGKLYAVPVNANITASDVMTFSKKYLDKYHLSINGINSFASAEKVLSEFHKNNPNIAALAIGKGFITPADVDYVVTNTYPFAVDVHGDTTKIQNVYDIKSMRDNLKAIRELYVKGIIPADAATTNTTYDLNANNWFARVETQGPFDYGDTALTLAGGQPMISKTVRKPMITTVQARTADFVISKTSKHKIEALKALEVINTDPELLNGLVYGTEGKDWKKIGDKKIKLLPDYYKGTFMGKWNTGNNALYYTTKDVTKDMIIKRDQIIKDSKVSPLLGFNFDSSKVRTELTNISNVMSKYSDSINTGTVDPEVEIPKLKSELQQAGFDKVQKEMQEQYNVFLKNKNK